MQGVLGKVAALCVFLCVFAVQMVQERVPVLEESLKGERAELLDTKLKLDAIQVYTYVYVCIIMYTHAYVGTYVCTYMSVFCLSYSYSAYNVCSP